MTKALTSIQEELKKELAAVEDTISSGSGNFLSTKGRVFTFPDGTQNPGPISAIVLDYANHNQYYDKPFNANNPAAPVCFAIGRAKHDNLTPHEDVADRQSDDCKSCPMNQWGSAPNGNGGKACKNVVNLAILPPDFDPNNATPFTIKVAPTGLSQWSNYVTKLKSMHNILPIQAITEIRFKEGVTYPTLEFSFQKLHDQLEQVVALRAIGNQMVSAPPRQ